MRGYNVRSGHHADRVAQGVFPGLARVGYGRAGRHQPGSCRCGLPEVLRLEPAEYALNNLSQSVYHQRLRATDRCMEGLYDTTRRIRDFAEAYPEIAEQGKFLLDLVVAKSRVMS